MVKQFDVSEIVTVIFIDDDGYKSERDVCPDCKDHIQIKTEEKYSCKNIFVKKGEYGSRGQCSCYSKSHVWGKLV